LLTRPHTLAGLGVVVMVVMAVAAVMAAALVAAVEDWVAAADWAAGVEKPRALTVAGCLQLQAGPSSSDSRPQHPG
jgi:hypothetical protein